MSDTEEEEGGGREREREIFHPPVHSLEDCNNQDWTRSKLPARNIIQVSHAGDRGPSTWARRSGIART